MAEREGLSDTFRADIIAEFQKQTSVSQREDLSQSDTATLLGRIKPLFDLVAKSSSFIGQERAMLEGIGISPDGHLKGIRSPDGLTLEESFTHSQQTYLRNIFWDPRNPDQIEIYSMPRRGGFEGMSRVFNIPLDGNLTTLRVK